MMQDISIDMFRIHEPRFDPGMVTAKRIDRLDPIPGADRIECATLGGWKVVVKKGDFHEGELVAYFRIDSWIPRSVAPFLCKEGVSKVYKGIEGERLRTVKLRGQISQGLVLPLRDLVYETDVISEDEDLGGLVDVYKWEREVPTHLSGTIKGNFPSFIRKTDQERVQNLKMKDITAHSEYQVTEKLDGSSMTVYYNEGVFGVCSRNLDLKEDENNTFWKTARKLQIEDRMKLLFGANSMNVAIQGELVGPGVQGNYHDLSDHAFYVFDMYDIDRQEYFTPEECFNSAYLLGLEHVPVLYVSKEPFGSYAEYLAFAEGNSNLSPTKEREGLVFKNLDRTFTFKAISNKWLLENE